MNCGLVADDAQLVARREDRFEFGEAAASRSSATSTVLVPDCLRICEQHGRRRR